MHTARRSNVKIAMQNNKENETKREEWKRREENWCIDFYWNDCMVKIYIFSRRMRNEIASLLQNSAHLRKHRRMHTIFHTVPFKCIETRRHTHTHTNTYKGRQQTYCMTKPIPWAQKNSCAHIVLVIIINFYFRLLSSSLSLSLRRRFLNLLTAFYCCCCKVAVDHWHFDWMGYYIIKKCNFLNLFHLRAKSTVKCD